MARRLFPERSLPTLRRVLTVLALASAGLPVAGAQADVVATDRSGAAVPVLWNGGVAWEDLDGVLAATPGSAPRRLVSFPGLGRFSFDFALDSGSGSGGVGSSGGGGSGGALAYGWQEADEQFPNSEHGAEPMRAGSPAGSIPAPPSPAPRSGEIPVYEVPIDRRGVIGADGHVTQLSPDSCSCSKCGAGTNVVGFFPAYLVSLASGTVAYGCRGVEPPGGHAPSYHAPSYVALSDVATLSNTAQTIPDACCGFQLSGNYIAYYAGESLFGSGPLVVENRQTGAVSYEVPNKSTQERLRTIALQEDGTLVLLEASALSTCGKPGVDFEGPYPAEWFSPASPVAHQLGCFYDGSPRPVGGQWVALRAGPGTQASLVLISLATGSSRTLAVFPWAGMFGGADFDGKRLAWARQTCAGTAVQLTPDVSAMSPGPPLSTRCPVLFHLHGALHVAANGIVRVAVSCPLGCEYVRGSIAQPRALVLEKYFSLPASTASRIESFRLSRRQRDYLRRHRRVRVKLVVGPGPGDSGKLALAPDTKSTWALLVR